MEIIKNESAQFMLLAGFIIAIGLVITTVMLNNIIFESNMAGEAGGDPIKYDIVNLMRISGDEMKSAYRNATALGGNDVQKRSNFINQTQNFSANLPMLYALHGEGVNVIWDVSNWKNGIYANFTDNGTANGATNWTVMESVKTMSVFELRNVNVSGSNFMVNVSNQTTGAFLWSMKLTGSGNIEIRNYTAPTTPTSYGVNYDYINLTNSTYKLTTIIGNNITKITFLNGSNAWGMFNLTGTTSYGNSFTRARDYILYSTVTLSTSLMRTNITIPVSVPW
ncbi:MAG: hypothetical protein OIN85_00030 [Candidatus Methanoperedens sp.]|nr:hypothetical protein [Candidatus Methanoperedens sp.]